MLLHFANCQSPTEARAPQPSPTAESLPEPILTRQKRGFGPPLMHWFKQDLGSVARRDLLDGEIVSGGWIARERVARLTDPARKRPKGSRIWRLLVLEHWLRRQAAPAPTQPVRA